MNQIFKVFRADSRRLSSNVVAIVLVMGLTIIPALYAWFNILSNWDPYGKDATSQMKIAVCSADAGFKYEGLELNVGESVTESLKSNTTVGWVFCDTKDEALEGVRNGEYYAALIIPDNFTTRFLSFIGGNPVNPTIEYYENSKKNAIATKITSKVKSTVVTQVNEAFISTLTQKVVELGKIISPDSVESVANLANSGLKGVDTSLDNCISMLDTLIVLGDTTQKLIDSTQAMLPNVQNIMDGSQDTLTNLQISVATGSANMNAISTMIDINIDTVIDGLDGIDLALDTIDASSDIDLIYEKISSNLDVMDETVNVLSQITTVLKLDKDAQTKLDQINSDIIEFKKSATYTELRTDMATLKNDLTKTNSDVTTLRTNIKKEIAQCKTDLKNIKNSFDVSICPNIDSSVTSVTTALVEIQSLLGSLDDSFLNINSALTSYQTTLGMGSDELKQNKAMMEQLKEQLAGLMNGISVISSNDEMTKLLEKFVNNPEQIAQFVSSPVELETVEIYEIETYGSAMAPFYTVLALWVGALILVALIKVKVLQEEGLEDTKPVHHYFGRYILFFLIGQVQALITVLGDLFFIGIQCKHKLLFWLACSIISFVFTLFIYSLTVAFGNVGQALAVIVMVVQVAGAGGTFPVEVLPHVYQVLYKYLPFTYSMNALRECVGGMYGVTYGKCIVALLIYGAISVVIGTLVAIPFRKMNDKIERSKEKSGIMI